MWRRTAFITFAALALHHHPERREEILEDPEARWRFVQEVRRLTPFFPFVGGRVQERFAWRGQAFLPGDWVILDLYGTNRDPRSWPQPERFDPDRFRDRPISAFDMVPQGGGDFLLGHRCAGEWLTIALMDRALLLLTGAMRYRVAEDQDLSVDLGRMPALPASGFVIDEVEAQAMPANTNRVAMGSDRAA